MVTTNFADWCASYFAQSVTKVIQLRQMWSCLVEQRPLRVSLLHFFLSWTFECGPGVASPNSSSQPKHLAARCFWASSFPSALGFPFQGLPSCTVRLSWGQGFDAANKLTNRLKNAVDEDVFVVGTRGTWSSKSPALRKRVEIWKKLKSTVGGG